MQMQNIRYAELRTTPRSLPDGTTRRNYIETVLSVFREFEASCVFAANTFLESREGEDGKPLPRLIPRLLLSVDRGRSVEEAMEVARLAVRLKEDDEWKKYVVGVDFSGNPTKGAFEDFRSECAKRSSA